jgi:hypothetical protein
MRWFAIAALVAATGCATATQFWGSPKVQNGVAGCQAACAGWGMELAGMVKVGEYSDGCICQVKAGGAPPAQAPKPESSGATPPTSALPAGAGVGFMAATGVYLQSIQSQRDLVTNGATGYP